MRKIIRRMVVVEKVQTSILIDRTSQDFMICAECKRESLMFTPEKIADAIDFKTREIYRLVELNQVHFVERDNSKIFVCLESLLNQEK